MPVFHSLESQNPYPQAVNLTMDWQPTPDGEAWRLGATVDQQEQWLSLASGRIKVILRGGTLRLQGFGGTFSPYSDFPASVQLLHRSASEGQWQMQFLGGDKPLKVDLGCLTPNPSSHWQATFTITPADLAIADSQGLWPPDLSPNQLAIVDRLIAQFLVNDWFPPALSWSQWAIAPLPAWQPLPAQADVAVLRKKEMILGDRLQLITQTPNSDLLTLAQLVDLDPQRDLAGGKFVGANLSGIDLSGANLANSNFRGAILTDADLSGANLANSNFRGADLSGAYLENANLTRADFRKSSLALTNLIGADLTEANLQNTTLHSANLSAAKVQGTQLGDNPGLTVDQQTLLMENGSKLMPASDPEMLS
ncbi:MAG: pentapeptide repeat-containing protein [Synechocystis sp.]|nr:pentapeptide repeat-containing protein [Synechocystis sp.]